VPGVLRRNPGAVDVADNLRLWLIEKENGSKSIIWSTLYTRALAKCRRLKKGMPRDNKTKVYLIVCPVGDCFSFATELLSDEEILGLPNDWWIVGDVELQAGGNIDVLSVCPMCDKHARRFRKTDNERIFRIEERLDAIEKTQEES